MKKSLLADGGGGYAPRRMLVTGGAGFIGTNFVRLVLAERPEVLEVVTLDALTYAGNAANLAGLDKEYPGRHRLIRADIRDREEVARIFAEAEPDTVVNFAAESHVDRSIDAPLDFVETNVFGVAVLLESARKAWGGRTNVRFHHVSTDEVYGSLGPEGRFREDTPYDPSSPYSATKAGSDHLVRAWHRTYGLPISISNSSNNYGPWQFPEKLIPLMIANALEEKPLPVYGDGANIRDWLHVRDHALAILAILDRGRPGRTYNVGGGNEWSNLDLVRRLSTFLDELHPRRSGSYAELIAFVQDRPGHDGRYAVDGSRIRSELGWQPEFTFERGLKDTVCWYLGNQEWVRAIQAGKYDGRRLGTG